MGGYAILRGHFPKLKWAYAGFTFDFLGVTASHVLAGDSAHAIFPFLFFIVRMFSYLLGQKVKVTK